MSSHFIRQLLCIVIAALSVLTAHAGQVSQDVSFDLLEDKKQDKTQQEQQSVQSADTSDWSDTMDKPDWPSLQLDFKVKRKSMQVFGQSNFSIIATPDLSVHRDKVIYDAFATFEEDTTRHTYVLVNGTAYLETSPVKDKTASPTVKCVALEECDILLMVNSIIGMINEATASSSESERARIDCTAGDLFDVNLAGTEFSVCSKASGFTMHGSYMDVSAEYLEERAEIPIPVVDANELQSCEKLISASEVTSVGQTILTRGTSNSQTERKLEGRTRRALRNER